MKAIGAVLVALALIIGIVPQFTDCLAQGSAIELPNGKTLPMRCHWTRQAEVAVAFPLGIVGLLVLLSRRRQTLRALLIVAIVLGAAAILLPTVLIGVCAGDDTIALPAGTYTLALAGSEDNGATGDLDITARVTIQGAGTASTVVDANGLDRVFQIFDPAAVTILDLTI